MVDRYTKVVLTVIAVALIWLCLWGPGPKWGTPAEAQMSAVDVNIREVGGQIVLYGRGVPIEGVALQSYPVEVKPVR